MPLTAPISVIIPSYNRAPVLLRALNSVFRQDLAVAEVIVVDDGSTDETQQRFEELSPPPWLSLQIISQKNSGPAAARNHGIARSSQPYIAFLDSDDHWHRRKIACQFPLLLKNQEYMVSHTLEKWRYLGNHKNQKAIHIPRHGDIFTHCLRLCAVGMSTVIARRELFTTVGFFDEALPCCEDYDFWLRVSCRFPFLLVAEPLTIKEGGHQDQLSRRFRVGMDSYRLQSLTNLLKAGLPDSSRQLLTLKELVRRSAIYAQGCMKHDKPAVASQVLAGIPEGRRLSMEKFPELEEML
jgi:hypothetical protein